MFDVGFQIADFEYEIIPKCAHNRKSLFATIFVIIILTVELKETLFWRYWQHILQYKTKTWIKELFLCTSLCYALRTVNFISMTQYKKRIMWEFFFKYFIMCMIVYCSALVHYLYLFRISHCLEYVMCLKCFVRFVEYGFKKKKFQH